jgi:hypothetical protein
MHEDRSERAHVGYCGHRGRALTAACPVVGRRSVSTHSYAVAQPAWQIAGGAGTARKPSIWHTRSGPTRCAIFAPNLCYRSGRPDVRLDEEPESGEFRVAGIAACRCCRPMCVAGWQAMFAERRLNRRRVRRANHAGPCTDDHAGSGCWSRVSTRSRSMRTSCAGSCTSCPRRSACVPRVSLFCSHRLARARGQRGVRRVHPAD